MVELVSQLKAVEKNDRDAPNMSKSQNPTKEVIPILKKRFYRRTTVNDFQPQSISHTDLGGKLVFAIDVAKVDMVAALAGADGRVLQATHTTPIAAFSFRGTDLVCP
jgi:hypothetical protein